MPEIKNWFKKNKKTALLLAAIFIVGIFLRTYEFHDWLRFSKDQSRDARIISSVLKGEDHLPYLGPNAGVTKFRLGPAYYYFSYVSEKIFGNYPDKMAYPSLFFSILSIPLLFIFLREFFSQKISLIATAIASVSYFLVINSRFSSNPNLITFFVLFYLYSLLKLLNDQENKFYVWSAILGISMGIGVQLHTTLLITMPLMTFAVLFFIFLKNKSIGIWKNIAIILLFLLILNTGQIYSEFDSHGSNTKQFFKGFQKSSKEDTNFAKNLFLIASCQVQANSHIISSFQNDDPCGAVFRVPKGNAFNNAIYYIGIVITVLFSLAGYILLWRRFKKEQDKKKKNFLGIIILFNFISFLILVPIAGIIFVGYFINLFFIPMILLGLFIEEAEKKYTKKGIIFVAFAVIFLLSSSLIRNAVAAGKYMRGLENNTQNSTLGEIEKMRDYIFSTSNNYSHVYFTGHGNALTSRFYAPLDYFAKEADIKMERISLDSDSSDPKIDKNAPIYYIEENSIGNSEPGQTREGHEIISSQRFSAQTILILRH